MDSPSVDDSVVPRRIRARCSGARQLTGWLPLLHRSSTGERGDRAPATTGSRPPRAPSAPTPDASPFARGCRENLWERAGWLVRVGSENGHVVRRIQAVRREGVVYRASEVHLRKRAARFPERLWPTATRGSGSEAHAPWGVAQARAYTVARQLPPRGQQLGVVVMSAPRVLGVRALASGTKRRLRSSAAIGRSARARPCAWVNSRWVRQELRRGRLPLGP